MTSSQPLWPHNQEWHWTAFTILAKFMFSSLKLNCEFLQFCSEIYLFISWCQTICCLGAWSSLGRLHRHLYSPVPNHFPTTTTFLANASIPSIRSALPSYYSTLYPLPWGWSCTSVLCSFYVLKFQIGKRLWLLFSVSYAISWKTQGFSGCLQYRLKKLLIFNWLFNIHTQSYIALRIYAKVFSEDLKTLSPKWDSRS